MKRHILVTGAAGFIGYHLSNRLLDNGYPVIGIDNLNDYYDVQLKAARLNRLKKYKHFSFLQVDIADHKGLFAAFEKWNPPIVINLAAQAGVRYSIENPYSYVDSNLKGFANILEACRHYPVEHLLYASSSSVYGANRKLPFSTNDPVDHPVSLYAATKKANELMAHTYSHLYHIPVTGLRFFTVYGPWGRPDMAYFTFTKNILEGNKIKVFNHGDMKRDFTYVDDIVEGIVRLIDHPPVKATGSQQDTPNLNRSEHAPYRVYNIGNNKPVHLLDFIKKLELTIGKKAILELLPMQSGDMKETYADISDLQEKIGFSPHTPIDEGLEKFVEWYKNYYRVSG